MSYTKLVRFGTVDLPPYRPEVEAGTAGSLSAVVETPGGGFFDGDGAGVAAMALPYELRYRCAVVEDTSDTMRSTLAALRGLRGQRLKLWRQHMDSSGALEYVWARLSQMKEERERRHYLWQPVELTFSVLTEWRGAEHGAGWYLNTGKFLNAGLYLNTGDAVFTLSAGSGNPNTVTLTNASATGGTAVHAVKITLTCGATTAITAVTITNTTTLCKATWTGTLATGKALIIDCGAQTVINAGADAFAGFALDGSNHKNAWWFELAPGANTVEITLTGGSTDSALLIEYADGWE